jgi:hypothetical protein
MFNGLYCAIVVLLSLTTLPVTSYGQKLVVGGNIGYATFGMGRLKEYQQELKDQYPIRLKDVESFPPYLNYSLNVVLSNSRFYYGLMGGHTSTAGRNSYADYSGSATVDLLVRMNYVGALIATNLTKKENTNIYAGVQSLMYFNKLEVRNTLVLGDDIQAGSQNLHSINLAAGAFFELQQKIHQFILKATVGGEVHLAGNVLYDGSKYDLTLQNGDAVTLNASGLRAGIGIAYQFKGK